MRRSKISPIVAAVFTTLSCSGCGIPNFTKFVQLGGLRVLTIKANTPEVDPTGVSVQLTPAISDLNGGGRTLTVNVQTCADTGVSVGGAPACTNPDTNNTTTFSSTTLGSNNTYTGDGPVFTVNVPANPVNYSVAPAFMQYNGVAYLVLYTISAPDGSTVTALKRIVVSSPAKTKNNNPAIGNVAANGAALAASNAFTSALLTLGISYTAAGESYQLMQPDGTLTTQTETLDTTWFYSDGSTEYDRTVNTDSNQWTPPDSHPSGRAAVLGVVTHDGRGGEDYQIYNFN